MSNIDFDRASRTAPIWENSRYWRIRHGNHTFGSMTTIKGNVKLQQVTLIIRGIQERVALQENVPVLIGRFHPDNRLDPDVDLGPYDAAGRGVSRIHAKLELKKNNHIYITDLDSTNGTYVRGVLIKPRRRYILHHQDMIVLGKLVIQILFG